MALVVITENIEAAKKIYTEFGTFLIFFLESPSNCSHQRIYVERLEGTYSESQFYTMIKKEFEISEIEDKEKNFTSSSDFWFSFILIKSFKIFIKISDISFFNVVH